MTGGTGVVGRAVVCRLLAEGRLVRGLARSQRAAQALRELGAEPVPGDVLDPSSLEGAFDGSAAVFHVAGVNQFCEKDPSSMYRANVEGSANVVEAAARVGVSRLVYTSSAVTLGEARGTVGREDSAHRGRFLSSYERSKFDAERRVLELADRLRLEVVCVNPSSVQGPGRATGTGQVLVEYLRGRLRAWVDTSISLVDIDDCADGHLRAEAKGQPGQRYVLNAASLGTPELLALLRRIVPRAPTPWLVPAGLAVTAVAAVEAAGRLRGRTPLVCRESLRTLLHGHRYDGSKAERELGLQYRPVEDTLRRTAMWLIEEGLVPADALE